MSYLCLVITFTVEIQPLYSSFVRFADFIEKFVVLASLKIDKFGIGSHFGGQRL